MKTLDHTMEDAAVDIIKGKEPKLFETISTLIERGQSAKQIDRFIARRLGLSKGNPVRDMAYLAACSLERKKK